MFESLFITNNKAVLCFLSPRKRGGASHITANIFVSYNFYRSIILPILSIMYCNFIGRYTILFVPHRDEALNDFSVTDPDNESSIVVGIASSNSKSFLTNHFNIYRCA